MRHRQGIYKGNKDLIIGMGEVGTALWYVLHPFHTIATIDLKGEIRCKPQILHICFPFSKKFISEVKRYQKLYKPKFTIIHSTVPIGTSRRCGAIHSPIRGMHPKLEESLRMFPKFLGGKDASKVADYFRKAGMKVILVDKQETTEALKLFDTEYYKVVIEFCHRVKKYCDFYELNFSDIYRLGNLTYNEGYAKLGYPEYTRPILEPIRGPISGHCVLPNSALLKISEDAVYKGTSKLIDG